MPFEKISAKTLRQKVYDQLRDKIISAEILPGETITLRDLAEKFSVSLMPVREALWQLESQKVIVIHSNKAIRVNELTATEMEEALRLRILLESMAAQRSCDRRPDGAVQKVKGLLEQMRNSVGKRPKIYMRKNTEFHFAIYSYAESPLLLEIIGGLWARVGPYVYRDAVRKRDLGYAMKCHQEMFEGFAKKNKILIADALQRDLEAAAEVIIPSLEK
jgi:DNA-binding GntR family transcriptional regulator